MNTTAFDVITLVKALKEAESFIAQILREEASLEGLRRLQWQPINDKQTQFMQRFDRVWPELARFPELQAWARWTAEEINQILADHGFSIRLDPWQNDRIRFGVAAIYDLTVKWLVKGRETDSVGQPYRINERPAYRLPAEEAQVQFINLGDAPVIRIPGQNAGDYVCITRADERLDGFRLLTEVERLRREVAHAWLINKWGGVVLPNVLFDTEVDVSWLVGLHTSDETRTPWAVEQAKMQAKFAMGPEGARANVAAAIAVKRGAIELPKPDYVIDHDVVLWFEREGVAPEPLFSAYVPLNEFARRVVGLDEI